MNPTRPACFWQRASTACQRLGHQLSNDLCARRHHAGGPPWPHLALALLVILGTRSYGFLAVVALGLACILATLHARGLRCARAHAADLSPRLQFPQGCQSPQADARQPSYFADPLPEPEEDTNTYSIFVRLRHRAKHIGGLMHRLLCWPRVLCAHPGAEGACVALAWCPPHIGSTREVCYPVAPGRVVMRVDATGRLGLAVIRHGAPVAGLQAGAQPAHVAPANASRLALLH